MPGDHDDSGTSLNPLAPKRRVWRACQSCRRKKIKCSGDEPTCSQCSKSGSECIWQVRKQNGVAMGSSYAKRLESRILSLETNLLQLAPWAIEPPLAQVSASRQTTSIVRTSPIPTLSSLNHSQNMGKSMALTIQGETQTSLPGKRRIGLSCDECRRKKIKCDKSKPTCSQCAASHWECTWLHSTGYNTDLPQQQYLQDLEARALRLESITLQIQSLSSMPSTSSPNFKVHNTAPSAVVPPFTISEIPKFRGKNSNSPVKGRQTPVVRSDIDDDSQRGRSRYRPHRAGSLPDPRKSVFSFPSQLTTFPPPPPLPSKNYDSITRQRQREQRQKQREQVTRLFHRDQGRVQQLQGQDYTVQEHDEEVLESAEWRHYTIYGDLRSRSMSSNRLTERDPVLSRPFPRLTSRPSSVHDLPVSNYHPSKPASLASSSHLAKPLPLPSDLKLRLRRMAREQEWGRIGNRYSGYKAYIGYSRRSSPHSIPRARYSRPPSPHPTSRPSSISSYTHRSPGPLYARMPSQNSSPRSSFSYHSSPRYSPTSPSPNYPVSASPQKSSSSAFFSPSPSPSSYFSRSSPSASTSAFTSTLNTVSSPKPSSTHETSFLSQPRPSRTVTNPWGKVAMSAKPRIT